MKKIIVCGALFHLICVQVHAVQIPGTSSEKISTSAKSYRGLDQAEATHQKKTNNTTRKLQSIGINCDYRISAETQKIDEALVVSWAEYAVLHSFDFDFLSFDIQLKNLRACYTKNGWIGFINALKDSGNINLIKTQNLMVKSTLDGEVRLIDAQENQWKITVPIKVFYKNDKEEVTHFLNVYLIISWRNAFKLGIVQMITIPRFAPLYQIPGSIRDSVKSLSLSVTHQINSSENLKLVTSFLASLYAIAPRTSFSETDRVLSQPELCLKLEYDNTRKIQHLFEEQKYQSLHCEKSTETQIANLTSNDYKNPVEIVEIEKLANAGFEWAQNQFLAIQSDIFATKLPKLLSYLKEKGTVEFNSAKAKGFEWAQNQFLAIKLDVFDTKLPKLLSYYKEKGTVGFNSALQKLDKMKVLKTQNSVSQQRDKKPQLIENKNKQANIISPMQVVHQNDKNQITQLLNVNLTVGRKINGELVILQMKSLPSVNTSSSNLIETLVSNANIFPSQDKLRADSTQKMQQNNKIQLVQNVEIPQSIQVPKTIFNIPSVQSNRPQIINCDYKIPDGMTKIDENLVIKWAEQAATQSFDFNSVSLETQLQKLESCYTAKGWEKFKSALDKSGNIAAIKSQDLIMSSKVSGQTKLIGTRNNQWDIELALQVVYQNKQVKVNRFLNVNLTVERKLTGEFGIMRIIATLNDPVNTDTAATNSSNKNIDSVQKTQPNNTVTQSKSPVTQSTEPALQNTQQSTGEQKADLIDCDYKIPFEIKKINEGIIIDWAKHAVTKSFNFDSESIDTQLKKLQSCYTEQGWDRFINALERSGNIKTFKTKKLSATSQIDGVAQIIESGDNKWTLTLPLKINYQFENSNVIQLLKIDLTIGRKNTGGLGIVHLNSTAKNN